MKKSFFNAQKIVTLAILCFSAKGLNAQISPKEKEVTELSEIELPLRRISYGEFRDDFDRLISDNIRKEAKKLYVEQEAEKEVGSIEEIELPITKYYSDDGNLYASKERNYEESYYDYYSTYDSCSEPKKVVFYDGLGRKISDSISKDAKKLYEKQLRAHQWSSWRRINLTSFWYGFWELIKTSIYILLIAFAVSFIWRKVKDDKEKSAK